MSVAVSAYPQEFVSSADARALLAPHEWQQLARLLPPRERAAVEISLSASTTGASGGGVRPRRLAQAAAEFRRVLQVTGIPLTPVFLRASWH